MQSVRWAFLCFLCFVYGAIGTFLIGLGALAIIQNLASESLQAWTEATVGFGLIGAGSFALIVSLLAFIANAVAERQLE